MVKIRTDKTTRFNSVINVYDNQIKFDENGICHDINDDVAKQMVKSMDDINFYDTQKKETEMDMNKEDRIENTDNKEEQIESSQSEQLGESKTETLGDKGNEDEVPADTARKEFKGMNVGELRSLAVQHEILSEEDAKNYKKNQLVEMLTNQVSG